MKNLFLVIIIICFITSKVNAAEVNGNISTNTTWTKAQSPYIVTGHVLVESDATLTIEPGVEVRFLDSYILKVDGTLYARGTQNDSIKFTSNTSTCNWSLRFTDSAVDVFFDDSGNYVRGCVLEYCVLENSNGGSDMLWVHMSVPFLQNNTFKNSNYAVTVTGSQNITLNTNTFNNCSWALVVASSGTIIVSNSLFTKCALAINSNTDIIIDNNVFTENSRALYVDGSCLITKNIFAYNKKDPNLSIYPIIYLASDSVKFTNNLCQNNYSGLLQLSSTGYASIESNAFTDNFNETLIYLSIGYHKNADSVYFRKNIISNNKDWYILNIEWHGGMYFHNACCVVSSNTLINNYSTYEFLVTRDDYTYEYHPNDTIAIILRDNIITRNSSDLPDLLNFIGSRITLKNNNLICNETEYTIRNENWAHSKPYLNVGCNYWGDTTESEIKALIRDHEDNELWGGYTIMGCPLSEPAITNPVFPPANISRTDLGDGKIRVSWSANPDSVKGYNVYWGKYSGFTFKHMADAENSTTYTIEGFKDGDSIAVTAYDQLYIPNSITNWFNDNMFNGHESAYAFGNHLSCIFTLDVEKVEETNFTIYPNPVIDKLNVSLKKAYNNASIRILNIQGQTMRTLFLSELNNDIDVHELQRGIYLLCITTNKGTLRQKFIKL